MSVIDRRARQKAEIRQRILDAARQIAREKDWSAVTIRSIADAIEYTPPIVYEHFENKEDVLLNIVKEGHAQLRRKTDEVLDMDLSAEEKIVRLSMAQWDFANEQPEVFRLMHNPERMDQQRDMVREEMQEAKQKIENLFREVCPDVDPIFEVIFNWFCLMQGYINLITSIKPQEGERLLKKVEDPKMVAMFQQPKLLFERAIRRFIRGL